MAIGMVKAIYKLKYSIICWPKNMENGKSTGKMARAQGKDREFCINWSVATLFEKSVLTEGVVKCEALNFEVNSALILI